MASTLAVQLFSDWNHWRRQTRSFAANALANEWAMRDLKETEERLQLFEEMIVWCRERKLEPRLWLMCLFKIRMWTFPPKLERGSLMSENVIPKVKKQHGLGIMRARLLQTARQHTRNDVDPNRDLLYAVEALKQRYANEGASERCLDEALVRTNGFHEKSPVCQRCPVSGKCSIKLMAFCSFDILALRAGRITAEEAEKQARLRHDPSAAS